MRTSEFAGHVRISAIQGVAALTVYRRAGNQCVPHMVKLLEPGEVQQLRNDLNEALALTVPRMRVGKDGGTWRFACPDHPNLPGRFINQAAALAAAYRHLNQRHPSTTTRGATS